MATNYLVNIKDLDEIFLPLKTTKRADVNYVYEKTPGVFEDISNRYEPKPDPQDSPGEVIEATTTNYEKYLVPTPPGTPGYYDLKKLFCSINFRGVYYEYYSESETEDSYDYGYNDNGIIYVRIVNANLASPETNHSYTITVYRGTSTTVSQTQTITFTGPTSNWVTFTGVKDTAPITSPGCAVTVTNNNGLTDARRFVPVGYKSPRTRDPATGQYSVSIGR